MNDSCTSTTAGWFKLSEDFAPSDEPITTGIDNGDTVTVSSPLPFEPLSELSKKQAAHDRLGGQIKADGGTIELDPSDQKLFLTTHSTTTNLQWDEDFGQQNCWEAKNPVLGPRHSYTLVPQKVDPNHKTLDEAFDFSDEDWMEGIFKDCYNPKFRTRENNPTEENLKTRYDDFLKKLETQTAAHKAKTRQTITKGEPHVSIIGDYKPALTIAHYGDDTPAMKIESCVSKAMEITQDGKTYTSTKKGNQLIFESIEKPAFWQRILKIIW